MPTLPFRPFLYPIVDMGVLGNRPVGSTVAALARGGARLIQFRAKGIPDRRLLDLAREALAAARAGGALLVINDRPDVAIILGADGVHVGQEDLSPGDCRALLPPGVLVGVSTHSLEQLASAAQEPVDYVAVGPVFPTRTKENPDPVVGLDLLRRARALVPQTLVAIGGITRRNAPEVVASGADGVAVVSDLLREPDLTEAVRQFRAALESVP